MEREHIPPSPAHSEQWVLSKILLKIFQKLTWLIPSFQHLFPHLKDIIKYLALLNEGTPQFSENIAGIFMFIVYLPFYLLFVHSLFFIP